MTPGGSKNPISNCKNCKLYFLKTVIAKCVIFPENIDSQMCYNAKLQNRSALKHSKCHCGGLSIVLYNGTRLYHCNDLVASMSEPVSSLLSIRYSFWYIISRKYFKMHEVYVFSGEQGRKLEYQLLFCFEQDASVLLHRREIITTRIPLETWRKALSLAFVQ